MRKLTLLVVAAAGFYTTVPAAIGQMATTRPGPLPNATNSTDTGPGRSGPTNTGPTPEAAPNYDDIQTVVVIYAENRSFDNIYGTFPGANGLAEASSTSATQLDRNGQPMRGLPAVWRGISGGVLAGAPTAPVSVTQGETATLLNTFNHPFDVAALYQAKSPSNADPLRYANRDLYHRFYENQMQINGGANNMFAAWADAGGLTMGYFAPTADVELPLRRWAQDYVLADNFFQAAFGGSFLNHFYLICSCAPYYGHGGVNPNGGANPTVAVLDADGASLATAANSPASAMDGPPVYVLSGNLTPDYYAVNTMMPPYPPSGNAIDAQGDTGLPQQAADLKSATTLIPQTEPTIGDLLTQAKIDWAWYAGAWDFALSHAPFAAGTSAASPNFQYHHQPFNYFAAFDPHTPEGAANRVAHLKDAGIVSDLDSVPDSTFLTDIRSGKLPPVSFYKPQGSVNEHAGYANVADGDKHIDALLKALKASPQWGHMLILVTFDEFGGWWDHAAPPKADRFGPGTRIPALIISPYAKHAYIDHTQYDTTSILRFITNKWHLPSLGGITIRDDTLVDNGFPRMGDLTAALKLP